MVNYEWYRSFVAVYQTGTTSTAAEKRFLTQPAVSQHIAALEQTSKVKLCKRTSWLARQVWVSYGPELPIIRRFYQEVLRKRPALRPDYIFRDLRTILEAVRWGLGVSVLPDYLTESAIASRRVKVLWQPEVEVTNQLYLACQLGRLREPAIEWAIYTLRPNSDSL